MPLWHLNFYWGTCLTGTPHRRRNQLNRYFRPSLRSLTTVLIVVAENAPTPEYDSAFCALTASLYPWTANPRPSAALHDNTTDPSGCTTHIGGLGRAGAGANRNNREAVKSPLPTLFNPATSNT